MGGGVLKSPTLSSFMAGGEKGSLVQDLTYDW